MSQPPSVMQLVMSIAISAVAIVAASAAALWLIPQVSLNAAIRGGSITFLVMLGVRVSQWAMQRKKASRGNV
jgi:hypothetical protein